MRIKDYAVYRAYYCGLCKCIGKHNPCLMRFGVNYDITFLTMLAHNYAKLTPQFEDGRCVIHEAGRKFKVVKEDAVQLAVCEVNTILGYYKVADDASDEKRLKHILAKAYINGKYKRAARKHKELDAALTRIFGELDRLEREDCRDIDALAALSGEMLVAIAKEVCLNPDADLNVLTDNLGRWIYVIDAFDDLAKDMKSGSFNPLKPTGTLTDVELDKIRTAVSQRLNAYIKEITTAYDHMDITIDEPPLSNVVYMGIPSTTQEILTSGGKKCKKTLL